MESMVISLCIVLRRWRGWLPVAVSTLMRLAERGKAELRVARQYISRDNPPSAD